MRNAFCFMKVQNCSYSFNKESFKNNMMLFPGARSTHNQGLSGNALEDTMQSSNNSVYMQPCVCSLELNQYEMPNLCSSLFQLWKLPNKLTINFQVFIHGYCVLNFLYTHRITNIYTHTLLFST